MNETAEDGKLPVFVFPNTLNFYLEDLKSHKQVLTIYNPYETTVSFKVLSTAPRKYTVVNPEGSIKPKCCVDIVIRHVAPSLTSCNTTDKFRVQLTELGSTQITGKKDVSAILHEGRPDPDSEQQSNFSEVEDSRSQSRQRNRHRNDSNIAQDRRITSPSNPNYVALAVAALCVGALMLPTDGDTETQVPSYLHLTIHQKLVFAYTLGLMTMVILRN